ncbi:tetratricopeptide repeat protein [Photobacterium aphoticum]|uniref:Sel1 repeat family protein n=1 Tax=Photobacterium aphoticum TaxID=754436 RepID=A0A0J1GGI1_9GAMM|nr:tetratricopeptide repeat protein [Photobacterium aphoticum]KLU98827.1 hypothetical protein ABT58_20635 [Photobacterium aphoticum]PSU56760.1 sel1 repeat family protein [Photobacterium aphoticum]GHA65733.1 hypothetical protein GCM10007086_44180 [Photobacterium aphoticum]
MDFLVVVIISVVMLFIWQVYRMKQMPVHELVVECLNRHQFKEALAILSNDVDKGNYESAVMMAEVIEKFGLKDADDPSNELFQPIYWYEKAALLDEAFNGTYRLGLRLGRLPNGTVIDDGRERLELILLIDAANGKAEQQYELGMLYSNFLWDTKKIEESQYWLDKAAEQGHEKALFEIGSRYISENLNNTDDYGSELAQQARQYISKAVSLGYQPARKTYADMLIKGIGGDKQLREAEGILLTLCEEFHDQAENDKYIIDILVLEERLAKLYVELNDWDNARLYFEKYAEYGKSGEIALANFLLDHSHSVDDHARALSLVKEGADGWHTDVLAIWGKAYETGRGVSKNLPKAAMHYQLASITLNPRHIESKQALTAQLTTLEKHEVTILEKEYRALHPISEERQRSINYCYASNLLKKEDLSCEEAEEGLALLKQCALAGAEDVLTEIADVYMKLNKHFECALWLKVSMLGESVPTIANDPVFDRSGFICSNLYKTFTDEEKSRIEKDARMLFEQIEKKHDDEI